MTYEKRNVQMPVSSDWKKATRPVDEPLVARHVTGVNHKRNKKKKDATLRGGAFAETTRKRTQAALEPNQTPPFVDAQNLYHISQVEAFDRETFLNHPDWDFFIRRGFPFELPPGSYDELRDRWGELFILIHHTNVGEMRQLVFSSVGGLVKGQPTPPIVGHVAIKTFDPMLYYRAKFQGGAYDQN